MRVTVGLVTLALGANGCSREAPAPATTVRVVLEDGAGSGSYDAVSQDSACLPGLVGPGSWSVQFSDWKGPRKGLRSLQLVIPQSADTGQILPRARVRHAERRSGLRNRYEAGVGEPCRLGIGSDRRRSRWKHSDRRRSDRQRHQSHCCCPLQINHTGLSEPLKERIMIRNTARPVVALLLAGLVGCAKSAADTPLPTVTITAHEFGYQIPAVIPAGVSRIQIVNQGQELHHVQLVRLAEGHTAAELAKAIEGGAGPDWAIPVGGPNAAQPGDTSATIQSAGPRSLRGALLHSWTGQGPALHEGHGPGVRCGRRQCGIAGD